MEQMQNLTLNIDAVDQNQMQDGPQMTLHAPEYQPILMEQ